MHQVQRELPEHASTCSQGRHTAAATGNLFTLLSAARVTTFDESVRADCSGRVHSGVLHCKLRT